MYRRFYSTYGSGAFCYALFFGLTLVLLPLFLAYNSVGFWYKEGTYYEQPKVNYRYQTIVEMHGSNSNSAGTGVTAPFSLYFSSTPDLNKLHTSQLRSPVMKSAEFDDNHDGINDRIEITMTMPLQSTEEVTSFNGMVLFDVVLEERARVQFDSSATFSYNSGSSISSVNLAGDVMLRQTWPLSVRGAQKSPYAGNPLLPVSFTDYTSADQYSIGSISEHMSSRNFSTATKYTYVTATHATSALAADLGTTLKVFTATMQLRIPQQVVWFTPGVSETFKWAWMQYLSMFVVVWFILNRVSSFVFGHQLLYTRNTPDIIYQKMD